MSLSLRLNRLLIVKKTSIEEQVYHLDNETLRDNKEIEDLDNRINYIVKQIETLNELIKSIKESNKGFINKLKAMFNSEEDESYKDHNKEKQQLLTQQLELEKCKKTNMKTLLAN